MMTFSPNMGDFDANMEIRKKIAKKNCEDVATSPPRGTFGDLGVKRGFKFTTQSRRHTKAPKRQGQSSLKTKRGATPTCNRGPKKFSLCLNSKSMREKREGGKGQNTVVRKDPSS